MGSRLLYSVANANAVVAVRRWGSSGMRHSPRYLPYTDVLLDIDGDQRDRSSALHLYHCEGRRVAEAASTSRRESLPLLLSASPAAIAAVNVDEEFGTTDGRAARGTLSAMVTLVFREDGGSGESASCVVRLNADDEAALSDGVEPPLVTSITVGPLPSTTAQQLATAVQQFAALHTSPTPSRKLGGDGHAVLETPSLSAANISAPLDMEPPAFASPATLNDHGSTTTNTNAADGQQNVWLRDERSERGGGEASPHTSSNPYLAIIEALPQNHAGGQDARRHLRPSGSAINAGVGGGGREKDDDCTSTATTEEEDGSYVSDPSRRNDPENSRASSTSSISAAAAGASAAPRELDANQSATTYRSILRRAPHRAQPTGNHTAVRDPCRGNNNSPPLDFRLNAGLVRSGSRQPHDRERQHHRFSVSSRTSSSPYAGNQLNDKERDGASDADDGDDDTEGCTPPAWFPEMPDPNNDDRFRKRSSIPEAPVLVAGESVSVSPRPHESGHPPSDLRVDTTAKPLHRGPAPIAPSSLVGQLAKGIAPLPPLASGDTASAAGAQQKAADCAALPSAERKRHSGPLSSSDSSSPYPSFAADGLWEDRAGSSVSAGMPSPSSWATRALPTQVAARAQHAGGANRSALHVAAALPVAMQRAETQSPRERSTGPTTTSLLSGNMEESSPSVLNFDDILEPMVTAADLRQGSSGGPVAPRQSIKAAGPSSATGNLAATSPTKHLMPQEEAEPQQPATLKILATTTAAAPSGNIPQPSSPTFSVTNTGNNNRSHTANGLVTGPVLPARAQGIVTMLGGAPAGGGARAKGVATTAQRHGPFAAAYATTPSSPSPTRGAGIAAIPTSPTGLQRCDGHEDRHGNTSGQAGQRERLSFKVGGQLPLDDLEEGEPHILSMDT